MCKAGDGESSAHTGNPAAKKQPQASNAPANPRIIVSIIIELSHTRCKSYKWQQAWALDAVCSTRGLLSGTKDLTQRDLAEELAPAGCSSPVFWQAAEPASHVGWAAWAVSVQ